MATPNDDFAAKLLASWEAGALTESEFVGEYVPHITPANAREAVMALPVELRAKLDEALAETPTTDEGWARVMIVHSYCGPALTVEDTERRHAEEIRAFRTGIEALRASTKQKE